MMIFKVGRNSLAVLLLFHVVSYAQLFQGKVVNRIEQALKGAEVCLLGFTNHCTMSNDSGHWSLSLPVNILERQSKANKQASLEYSKTNSSRLIWHDVLGRPLVASGVSRLWLDRSHRKEIRNKEGKHLAKTAATGSYYIQVALAGYETEFAQSLDSIDFNWVSMRPEGEIRDHRSNALPASILSIEREQGYFAVKGTSITCDSGKRVEKVLEGKQPFYMHEGKLYLPYAGDKCRANRFTSNDTDIIGTWVLDESLVEMPLPFRPGGCPSVQPFHRPTTPGGILSYRFTNSEMTLEYSGPHCLSDERWFSARNLIMHNDRTIRWVENSCRRTAWINGVGDSAFQTFQIHGGRDSAKVTFTFKDKICSYIDGGLFSDPPPTCPDPMEAALETYLNCIAGSGFATITQGNRLK
jgi:hypothetical protein